MSVSIKTFLKQNVAWLLPLVLSPLLFGILNGAAYVLYLDGQYGAAAVVFFLAYAATTASLIAAIVTLAKMVPRWRERWRRVARRRRVRRNRLKKSEDRSRQFWDWARTEKAMLVARELPEPLHLPEFVAKPGELFFIDQPTNYARYYGEDVYYSHGGGVIFGPPLFVIAGAVISALSSASAASAAAAAAAAQWRDRQQVRLVVSNQRLLCFVQGRWLSFYFDSMLAVYPDAEAWSLVCQFENSEPLMLWGHSAPAAAVFTVLVTQGPDALAAHPGLSALDEPWEVLALR